MKTCEINVLVLAYLGDTIYENYVRRFLINRGIGNVNDLQKESVDILKHINNQDYVIALDIDGENLDSVSLAKKIDSTFLNYGTITFIIGSSFGLHDDIKRRANYRLSFSKLTFPHGLFRGILLEQIYRSFKILNNETYHK